MPACRAKNLAVVSVACCHKDATSFLERPATMLEPCHLAAGLNATPTKCPCVYLCPFMHPAPCVLCPADDAGGAELTICDPRSTAWSQYLNSVHGSASAAQMLAEAAAAEAAAAAEVASRSNSGGGSQELSPDRSMGTPQGPSSRDSSPTLTLGQRHLPGSSPPTPDVRLYHRAVVAPMEPPLR